MESEIVKPRWWAQAILIGAVMAAALVVVSGWVRVLVFGNTPAALLLPKEASCSPLQLRS